VGVTETAIGGRGAIVRTEDADTAGLVVDFAVTVTVVPVGIAEGGV
jgi:hypothetical protein